MSLFEYRGAGEKCDHVSSRFTKRTGYAKILLLGLPASGKTSVFNLLTDNEHKNSADSFIFSTTGMYRNQLLCRSRFEVAIVCVDINVVDIHARIVQPLDSRMEWMRTNLRCTSTHPLKVSVIDTPSLVAGSNRVWLLAVCCHSSCSRVDITNAINGASEFCLTIAICT